MTPRAQSVFGCSGWLLDKKNFVKFFLAYILLLLLCAFFGEGWFQADEHARVVEPAHFLVYGYATLPWEFDSKAPMVSYLLGAIHSPVLFVTKVFHATGSTEAFLLRFFSGVVNSSKLVAFYLCLPFFTQKRQRYGLYLLLFAFCIFTPLLLVRTSQENWSSTALMWACYLFLKLASSSVESRPNWQRFLLGVFIALAFSFRFQMGFSAAALGLFCLATFGFKQTVIIGLGVLVGLLPMAVTDSLTTGVPFLPALNYLGYGTSVNSEPIWGTSPWWWYFEGFFTNFYPPLSLALFPLLVYGLFRHRLLLVVFLPFFAMHQYLDHKEMRYYFPMLPFVVLAIILGWEGFEARHAWASKLFTKKVWARVGASVFVASALVSMVMGMMTLNSSPRLYEAIAEVTESHPGIPIIYAANSRSNVAQFYFKMRGPLPRKLSFDDFVHALENDLHLPEESFVALYRVQPSDLARVEKFCPVYYLAVSPLMRKVLTYMEPFPGKRRLDALVHCASNPLYIRYFIKDGSLK